MKILAFETSCDDTGVAVVEDGVTVLANVRQSQTEHSKWGGVVPELASRLHSENIIPVLEKCLSDAKLKIEDIDAIAVTQGPGLSPALLNGTTVASMMSLIYQKPVIPVHHIFGHISSVFLGRDLEAVKFPALVLTVSGGHTEMHLWSDFADLKLLGSTIDDAAGEAFDKTAKMLGLGYPGGPIVSKESEKGDENAFKLPLIYLNKESLDFSFSGLKAAIYREVEKQKKEEDGIDKIFIADLCASFESTVARTFVKKVARAIDMFPEIQDVVFVGGVSANTKIRKELNEKICQPLFHKDLVVPKTLEYCTDNAAMIGAAAFFVQRKNPELVKVQFVDADARLTINS